jgi:hypothetical protein
MNTDATPSTMLEAQHARDYQCTMFMLGNWNAVSPILAKIAAYYCSLGDRLRNRSQVNTHRYGDRVAKR